MKRWGLLLLGIFLILAGLFSAALGAGALALFGSDDSVVAPAASAQGSGSALIIENVRIDASSIPVPHGVGTLRLSASSPAGTELFLGTATPANVDTYLTGAPYDVVTDLTSGEKASTRSVPGSQQPSPPGSQSIWIEKASGQRPSIHVGSGSHDTIVVMNSDASNGVSTNLVVSLQLPGIWRAGWIAVGLGVLGLTLGGVSMWRSVAARRRGKHAAAHAAADAQGHPAPEHSVDAAPATSVVLPDAEPPIVTSDEPVAAGELQIDPTLVSAAVAPEAAAAAFVAAEVRAETPVAEATVVEPAAALDPALIPPWTYVESAPVPAAVTSVPEVATPAAGPPAPEVPVWESESWFAPETKPGSE